MSLSLSVCLCGYLCVYNVLVQGVYDVLWICVEWCKLKALRLEPKNEFKVRKKSLLTMDELSELRYAKSKIFRMLQPHQSQSSKKMLTMLTLIKHTNFLRDSV